MIRTVTSNEGNHPGRISLPSDNYTLESHEIGGEINSLIGNPVKITITLTLGYLFLQLVVIVGGVAELEIVSNY